MNKIVSSMASAALLSITALTGSAYAQSAVPAAPVLPSGQATPATPATPTTAIPASPRAQLKPTGPLTREPVVAYKAPDLATINADSLEVTVNQWTPVPAKPGYLPTIASTGKEKVILDFKGNHARIEQFDTVSSDADKPAPKPSILVSDGKTITEYSAERGIYYTSKATALKQGLSSRLRLVPAGLTVALGWTKMNLSPAPDETVDGKTYGVLAWAIPVSAKATADAPHYTYTILVDKDTKLPARFSLTRQVRDMTTVMQRADFDNWKVNSRVDDKLFAYTPPASAKAFVEPVLLTAGAAAPDFVAQKWGGGDLKLSDYRGKVVVLDFWATWCGPCQRSMPHVQRVADSIKGQDVVVIGVCVWDEKAPYEKWVPTNQSKYTFQFAFDPAGRGDESIATKLFGVTGIPTTYIIDKDGKVADALVGYSGDSDKRLEASLTKLGVTVPGQPETKVASR